MYSMVKHVIKITVYQANNIIRCCKIKRNKPARINAHSSIIMVCHADVPHATHTIVVYVGGLIFPIHFCTVC